MFDPTNNGKHNDNDRHNDSDNHEQAEAEEKPPRYVHEPSPKDQTQCHETPPCAAADCRSLADIL